jgi:hypothetical protein
LEAGVYLEQSWTSCTGKSAERTRYIDVRLQSDPLMPIEYILGVKRQQQASSLPDREQLLQRNVLVKVRTAPHIRECRNVSPSVGGGIGKRGGV